MLAKPVLSVLCEERLYAGRLKSASGFDWYDYLKKQRNAPPRFASYHGRHFFYRAHGQCYPRSSIGTLSAIHGTTPRQFEKRKKHYE